MRRRPEEGGASVLVLGVVGAVLSLTAGALLVVSAGAGSHRARLAADLSALAAAQRLQRGEAPAVACSAAARVARANGAGLSRCEVGGSVVDLTVSVPVRSFTRQAVARARAGPAAVR